MSKMKERWAELEQAAKDATPGPWIAAGPSFGGEFPVYCEEVVVDREHDDDDGYGICQAPTGLEKESTHDMRYIAAANPAAILELLEVTKGLAEALHCFHRDYIAVHDVGDVEMQPAIYQARATLAKYEGVQSE